MDRRLPVAPVVVQPVPQPCGKCGAAPDKQTPAAAFGPMRRQMICGVCGTPATSVVRSA